MTKTMNKGTMFVYLLDNKISLVHLVIKVYVFREYEQHEVILSRTTDSLDMYDLISRGIVGKVLVTSFPAFF